MVCHLCSKFRKRRCAHFEEASAEEGFHFLALRYVFVSHAIFGRVVLVCVIEGRLHWARLL